MINAIPNASFPRQDPQGAAPTPTKSPNASKSKQPKATELIHDYKAIPIGETLELRLQKPAEHAALDAWLKADSLRNLAT